MKKITSLLLGGMFFLLSPLLWAGSITNLSSNIQVLDPAPPDVTGNNLISDTTVFLFQEKSNFTLLQDVNVDVIDTGSFGGNNPDNSPGVVASGIAVDVYYVHSKTSGGIDFLATLQFDTEVLGIIASAENHSATNSSLGLAGVTYDNTSKFNLPATDDSLTLSPDRKNLSLNIDNGGGVDKVRILVASTSQASVIPEPGSLVLLLLGIGLFLRRR